MRKHGRRQAQACALPDVVAGRSVDEGNDRATKTNERVEGRVSMQGKAELDAMHGSGAVSTGLLPRSHLVKCLPPAK